MTKVMSTTKKKPPSLAKSELSFLFLGLDKSIKS